jgi:medium-chain acyl-CoA synthetase
MPHNMNDYESTRRNFELEVPKSFNFARDVFGRWGDDRLAMLWVDDHGQEVRKSFGDLSRESQKVAHVLSDAGVGRGDVVIAILPRVVEWWLVNLACLRLGAVLSPGTPQLTAKDIRFRIESADAR